MVLNNVRCSQTPQSPRLAPVDKMFRLIWLRSTGFHGSGEGEREPVLSAHVASALGLRALTGGCILRSASFWSLLLLQEFHYGLVHHSGSGESDEGAGRLVKEFLDGLIHHPSDGPAGQSTVFPPEPRGPEDLARPRSCQSALCALPRFSPLGIGEFPNGKIRPRQIHPGGDAPSDCSLIPGFPIHLDTFHSQ